MPVRIRTPEYYVKQKARRDSASEEEKERVRQVKRDWKAKNRDRIREQDRAWEKENPEKVKCKSLRKHFGITLEQYTAILIGQGGGCAICGTTEPGGQSKGYFHVDHDHKTDRVRGLLCLRCNLGLGSFKDEPERLEAAARYLRKING
jgi:hypothetical protein